MTSDKDLNVLAKEWNTGISDAVKKYLIERGITEETIGKALLGSNEFNGELRLTIPVFDKSKNVIGFKTRFIPGYEKQDSSKYLNYPTGVETNLYGIEQLYD